MTEVHITFDKLSDLHDKEINIQEEIDSILGHIDECPFCKDEFDRLHNSIVACSALRRYMVCTPGFSKATMNAIKWRLRRKLLVRYIPAVAASFVLVGGFALVSTSFNESNTRQITVSETSPQVNVSENIISILNAHNASILNVSEMFIDGEIRPSGFAKLSRELAAQKLFFSVKPRQKISERVLPKGINPLIHTVGSSDFVQGGEYIVEKQKPEQELVRFRIYK